MRGFVTRFSEKHSEPGARRAWTLYSCKLELEGGNESGWVSFGFDDPKLKNGDFIEVEGEEVNGRIKVASFQKLKNPPARSAKPAAGGASPASHGYETAPETAKRITYAAARTAAIEVVGMLLENDGLKMSAAKGEAGTAKRFAEITASIDKLTVEFYNDGMTLRKLDRIADAGAAEPQASSQLPDDAKEPNPDDIDLDN